MVVRIYWASVTGNRKIASEQSRLRNLVESLNVETVWIDITTSSEVKDEMRRETGIEDAMPPQMFIDDKYLGDISAMEDAVEAGEVRQWFNLPPKSEDVVSDPQIVKSEKVETEEKPKCVTIHATIPTKVVFSKSKTNHVNKSTLDNEERRKKILGL